MSMLIILAATVRCLMPAAVECGQFFTYLFARVKDWQPLTRTHTQVQSIVTE